MHAPIKAFVSFASLCACLVPLAVTAAVAPGDPDVAFGSDHTGVVSTALPNQYLEAHALAVQQDGRIVIAGQACSDSTGQDCSIAIERLTSDGTLDDTFNNSGLLTGLGLIENDNHAQAVEVTAEGLIVVAGYTCAAGQCSFLLLRLLPDGSPDTTFGDGGRFVPVNAGTGSTATAQAAALALQPDGRMLLAGFSNAGTDSTGHDSPTHDDFTLMRYYTNTVDRGFPLNGDGSGIVTIDFTHNDDHVNAVALQPDGKIVAAGETCALNSGGCSFAVARFNSDGTLDDGSAGGAGFNGAAGGTTKAVVPNGDSGASAVALQPDGKIVVAGRACTLSHSACSFAVLRYNADGSLDTADGQGNAGFGLNGSGVAQAGIGTNAVSIPRAVALQPDGKIVVAGYSNGGSSSNDLALVRFDADGTVDSGFGDNGVVVTDLGGGDQAWAVAPQPDGKLVVAGGSATNTAGSMVAARYVAAVTAWDTAPQAFHFDSVSGVAPGSVQISNVIAIAGLDPDVAVPVAVLNGTYVMNDSTTYTNAPGWARNGDRFAVRQVAASEGGQTFGTALVVGGLASSTNPGVTLGTVMASTFQTSTALSAPSGGGGEGLWSVAGLAVLAALRCLAGAARRRRIPG